MHAFGETDLDKKKVRINKKKSLKKGGARELYDTIKHEKIHIDSPKMLEKTVYKKTHKFTRGRYGKKNLKS